MAQPAPIKLDLSTLRSNGTGQGPQGLSRANYSQVHNQDARYITYIQETLTRGFNADAQLVATHGRHQFIGDLPAGYTLWSHQTAGQTAVLELYGNPRGGYYRSARRFSGHIGELLAANAARDAQIRAVVQAVNQQMAHQAIMTYNGLVDYDFQNFGIVGVHLDVNNLNHAHGLYLPRDAASEVLADQQNHAALGLTCNCVFRGR